MTAPARNSVKARRVCFETHRKQDPMGVYSRADARAQGLKTYFTGKPCVNGHVVGRSTANGQCLACNRKWKNAWKLNNSDKMKQYARSSRAKHLDARRTRDQQWRLAHVDENRERSRQWYIDNRDRHRLRVKRWRRDNPEADIRHGALRRGRKQGAEGIYSTDDLKRIFAVQKGRCAACHKKEKLTADHIIPLSKGGTNWPRNIQGLCPSCNSRKNARDPIEFMQSIGLLL